MIVDFDWAGEVEEVRYPAYLNRGPDLWRPDGAKDGELITTDHDMEMMEHIISKYLNIGRSSVLSR